MLRLEGGKYYVGKSDNVLNRYEQHVSGNGSAWTRTYKPITIEKTIAHASPFEEDKITKEYMSKYGVDNVRGGSYVEMELSDSQRESLYKEIWSAKDLCTRCGRPGHFIKDCYAMSDILGNTIGGCEDDTEDEGWGCEHCDRTFTSKFGASVHEKSCRPYSKSSGGGGGVCYRCGRPGHYSPDCYASKHIKGYYL